MRKNLLQSAKAQKAFHIMNSGSAGTQVCPLGPRAGLKIPGSELETITKTSADLTGSKFKLCCRHASNFILVCHGKT
jgi:hypothetical protein